MKKTVSITITAAVAALSGLSSCTAPKAGNADALTLIDLDSLKAASRDVAPLNDMDTRIIPLETGPDCMIDGVRKLVPYAGDYYALTQNSLLRFSADGRFICGVGARGNGPGEYISINDFCILSDTIYVVDSSKDKVVVYDTDGKYAREINGTVNLKFAIDMAPLDAETALVANGINFDGQDTLYALWNPETPTELRPVEKTALQSQGNYAYSNSPIAPTADGALFFTPLGNTIYGLDADWQTPTPRYEIKGIGYEEEGNDSYPELLAHALSNGRDLIVGLYDTDRYLFVNTFKGTVVWDKASGEGFYIASGSQNREGAQVPFIPLLISHASGRVILSVRQASEVLNYSERLSPQNRKVIEEAGLSQDSNPVIVKYSMK